MAFPLPAADPMAIAFVPCPFPCCALVPIPACQPMAMALFDWSNCPADSPMAILFPPCPRPANPAPACTPNGN